MPKRRVPLDMKQRSRRHTAGAGYAADIIPHHVDDHEVLGTVLGGFDQLGSALLILGGKAAAANRSLHRPCAQVLALQRPEQFRRSREQGVFAIVKIRGKMGLLGLQQLMEPGDRVTLKIGLQAQGVIHLIGVTAGDPFFDSFDGIAIGLRCNRRSPVAERVVLAGRQGEMWMLANLPEQPDMQQRQRTALVRAHGGVKRGSGLIAQISGSGITLGDARFNFR